MFDFKVKELIVFLVIVDLETFYLFGVLVQQKRSKLYGWWRADCAGGQTVHSSIKFSGTAMSS